MSLSSKSKSSLDSRVNVEIPSSIVNEAQPDFDISKKQNNKITSHFPLNIK